MFSHNPLLRKAFACFMAGIGLFFINVWFTHTFIIVFGCIMTIIGFLEIGAVYLTNYVDSYERKVRAQVEMIKALTDADPEVRNAIGAWFPRYNMRYSGQPVVCWQDTDVLLSDFREFMKESNAQYTAPERNWKARGNAKWRAWQIIYEKLVEIGLVVPDSAAGSHSYMWRGNGFTRAWEMWMQLGHEVKELD